MRVFVAALVLIALGSPLAAEPSPHPFRDTLPYGLFATAGVLADHLGSVYFSGHPESGCLEGNRWERNPDGTYNGARGLVINVGTAAATWTALYLAERFNKPKLRWLFKGANVYVGGQGAVNAAHAIVGCNWYGTPVKLGQP